VHIGLAMFASSSSSSPRIQRRGENVVRRRQTLQRTLAYIASSPLRCCLAALQRTVVAGGPDGSCMLYAAMGQDQDP